MRPLLTRGKSRQRVGANMEQGQTRTIGRHGPEQIPGSANQETRANMGLGQTQGQSRHGAKADMGRGQHYQAPHKKITKWLPRGRIWLRIRGSK